MLSSGVSAEHALQSRELLRELALEHAAEDGLQEAHRAAQLAVGAEAHAGAVAVRVERDPQVHGRAFDDPQREDAAGLELGHLDDRDELLAAGRAVDLAQAGPDPHRAVIRHGGDRVGLPGGQALGVADVVEDVGGRSGRSGIRW